MGRLQISSIILPTIAPVGTETETINNILEHISLEFDVSALQEKVVFITATEIVTAGFPGPLWAWIELSPVLSASSTAYWSAIGGGGGAIAPTAPLIIAGTGVTTTVHSFSLAWTMHSTYARLVMQTPVLVATAYWTVQAQFGAK
jgi:hypothetical protein